MADRPPRETVDLSQYPDLVVIYLGMRVNVLTGFKTLLGFGPRISNALAARPEGLLLHENVFYSLRHFGMAILARLRLVRSLVTIGAPPEMVAGIPTR